MNLLQRAAAPTPKFFKILRTVGLILLGISGSVFAAPVVLPAAVVTAAGYVAVVGGVLSAVSQVTVDDAAKGKIEANKSRLNSTPGNPHGHDPDIYGP